MIEGVPRGIHATRQEQHIVDNRRLDVMDCEAMTPGEDALDKHASLEHLLNARYLPRGLTIFKIVLVHHKASMHRLCLPRSGVAAVSA